MCPDLHIGLVDTPALADRALAAAERLFKHRQKLDRPSVHGRMIDRDSAFGYRNKRFHCRSHHSVRSCSMPAFVIATEPSSVHF